MTNKPVLTRYIDADLLNLIANRSIEPRQLVEGNLAGAHKSPMAGFAVEFAGHREYVPGDDPKHIDWRVYFNRDKYFVKQYELETNFVCHMLLDVSASMRYGTGIQQKLNYAARLVTTLAFAIIRQSDKVALHTFDSDVRGSLPASNSIHHVIKFANHLDEIEPVNRTQMTNSLSHIAARLDRRQIVMVCSDFFAEREPVEPIIQRLKYDQHEVVLLQVLHHDELAFEFTAASRFEGLEVDEHLIAHPDDVRDAYREVVDEFTSGWREMALRNGCEHVLIDTTQPLAEVLGNYLAERTSSRQHRPPHS